MLKTVQRCFDVEVYKKNEVARPKGHLPLLNLKSFRKGAKSEEKQEEKM